MAWKDEQHFESDWWGNCLNTYQEETKQIVYAKRMGLKAEMVDGKYPVYDLKKVSVLDIGGGPVSMLLKCINKGKVAVIDPCDYPYWVDTRYKKAEILYEKRKGEDLLLGRTDQIIDEIWIYNVLQHVDNPKLIIENAKKVSKIIRIFEWIDTWVSPGHPHVLKEKTLNEWLGGVGKVEQLNESGCHGNSYFGVFKGSHYNANITM
jgi:hypothetical protein